MPPKKRRIIGKQHDPEFQRPVPFWEYARYTGLFGLLLWYYRRVTMSRTYEELASFLCDIAAGSDSEETCDESSLANERI